MTVFHHRAFWLLALLVCGLTNAVVTNGIAAPAQPADTDAWLRRQAMIFFVAKGEPGACGPGCSEWIAAEGVIDGDAPQRFHDFLEALPRRDLPIFFNSTGGIIGHASAIGLILRKHRMTAGVGRTLPERCPHGVPTDEACRRVLRLTPEHRARLVTGGARCFSACVYAFVGGSDRQVARDAQLGIHSARMLRQGSPLSVDEVHHLLKRYVIEMGVDPGLIDAAAKVSPDRIRYMSRDEIARFGVETRGSYETSWTLYEHGSNLFYVFKSITQARSAQGKEYRTGTVRLWCVGGAFGIALAYQRELPANEIGGASVIRVTAGDSELVLKRDEATAASGRRSTSAALEILSKFAVKVSEPPPGSERWSTSAGRDFLRYATVAPSIVITEDPVPQGSGPGLSRAVKLSTNGLSKVLEAFQKRCGEPDFLSPQGVRFLNVPGVSGGR